MELWNFRGKQNSITAALQLSIPNHAVISITGSGGKTSLIFAWAHELAGSGKRTVITTTTHMAHPDHVKDDPCCPYGGVTAVFVPSDGSKPVSDILADIDNQLECENIVMVVSPDPERPAKVMSPPQAVMDHLYKTADVVLIEADGSRRMPLKWPAPWEPVVPGNTDITVCVAGLSSLGSRPCDVMYGYEYLPEAMRRETVDASLISAVLVSLDGGQKAAQGEYRAFLNQADNAELKRTASGIQNILAVCGIQSAWGTLL